MGKGSRSGKPSGSGASKVTKQSTAKAPNPGLRLPKFLLAPYVSKDGCPFYLKGAASEHALLSLENIAASRSYHNSEWARGRLGIAVSESAGVTQMGGSDLSQVPASRQGRCRVGEDEVPGVGRVA